MTGQPPTPPVIEQAPFEIELFDSDDRWRNLPSNAPVRPKPWALFPQPWHGSGPEVAWQNFVARIEYRYGRKDLADLIAEGKEPPATERLLVRAVLREQADGMGLRYADYLAVSPALRV